MMGVRARLSRRDGMLRKVSRNSSSELSSAVSAPPKLPVKAPHQRNVLGGRIVETEPENPQRRRNPPTDAPPAHLPPMHRPRRPLGPQDRGPPLFLQVVERPSRPPQNPGGRARRDHETRVVEPVETTRPGWSSPSAPRHRGGGPRRDHGTRVVEPVGTTRPGWSSPVETTAYVGDLDK